jgi:hypothetical protein
LVCDEVAKFVGHYVYHALQAAAQGEHFKMPPELTKEEALQVAVILSKVEEKR